MDKIKETNGNLDYKNDTVQLLLNYVKLRKIEEIAMRKKLKNISDLKKELEKYGLDANQRITFEDIKK
jgi:histone acetyltransferase (RNA polymerase elongator complex component)